MSEVTVAPQPSAVVRGAVRGTYLAFFAFGFLFANWAARIPQLRDRLDLDPAQLGLLLLCIAAGSVIALPLAGPLVATVGSGRTVGGAAVLQGLALTAVGFGYPSGAIPVAVALFAFGFAGGAWDVAMNVQGAQAERGLGRAIMPRFHAGYSVGTVAGAGLGAAMVAWSVPIVAHLSVVGLLAAVVVPFGVRPFLADPVTKAAEEPHARSSSRLTLIAWREPRTVLIGVFVLAFAFAEGAGNDWIGVALIDDRGVVPFVGTLGFAVFLTAMTVGRWFGPGLLDRFGRARVLRLMCGLALAGVALFVFAGSLPLALLGILLWGAGTALGFPVGMSAAADEPRMAAARVGVVASVGYCAFLGGPPLIGLLGSSVGVTKAIIAVAVLLGVAVAIAGATRPVAAGPDVPSAD